MAEGAISENEIANREHISPQKTGDNIAAKVVANYAWNSNTLQWERMNQPGGGSGGAVTVADGADVAEGTTTDAANTTGTIGTVSGKLRGIVQNQTNGTQKSKILDGAGNTINSLDDGNGGKALEIAQSATNFVFSSGNSSTAQLAAGATFTGTIENVINQQSLSVLLTSDQNGTLTLKQYIDAAGTRQTSSLPLTIMAGVGFSRAITLNGNYFNLTFQNTGGSTTTTLDINIYYGTIPPASTNGNVAVEDNYTTQQNNHQTLAANTDTTVIFSPSVRAYKVLNWDATNPVLFSQNAISSNSDSTAARVGIAPAANVPNTSGTIPLSTAAIHLRSAGTSTVTVIGLS